ncbi:unnamed protein product [Aphanomyces euteiches]|nr:hypothetical protein LEN26_017008 [Aphanomyces euteiches]KAH9146458.1 hypothetical protein AeRB84_009718 [Aphanomyces euteiches]
MASIPYRVLLNSGEPSFGHEEVPPGYHFEISSQVLKMTIAVGESLPQLVLQELVIDQEGDCVLAPTKVDVQKEAAGKTIAIVGVPGAFTPTCSNNHLPAYVEHYDDFKAAGVDEIWCLSVNDAFVMGAWGKDQKTGGKVRMIADGDGAFAEATGLVLSLKGHGLGVRSQRYSMLVKDGVVKSINVEVGGQLKVSDAATLLSQVGTIA